MGHGATNSTPYWSLGMVYVAYHPSDTLCDATSTLTKKKARCLMAMATVVFDDCSSIIIDHHRSSSIMD